jgi:hypothetical protein
MNAIFGAKCFNLVSAKWHYADVGYIADAFWDTNSLHLQGEGTTR